MQKQENKKDLITCVRLSKETRNRLADLGGKDQTFDEIINITIDKSLEEKCKTEDELAQELNDEREKDFS